ncbi:MAG: major capsid protein [Vibrio splendidus]
MALLRDAALNLSQDMFVRGVIHEIIDHEALFAVLPFTRVDGKAYVYNRESKLAGGNFVQTGAAIKESSSLSKQVTTTLTILIGDVDVDKFVDETMSDSNDQKAIQISMKAKGIGRRFKETLVNGQIGARTDPNGDAVSAGESALEFQGLRKLFQTGITDADFSEHFKEQVILAEPGKEITAANIADSAIAPQAMNLALLDELLDAVDNGADVIMMRRDALRDYKAILRTFGGNTAEMNSIPGFAKPIPFHDGVPIIINDFIPILSGAGDEKYSDIYAIRLNEADGLHGLFGGPTAGFRVEDIGTVQDKDATRTRIKWYCGLALKSTRSIAVLRGVKSARGRGVKINP